MMEHLVPVFHTTSIPIDGSSYYYGDRNLCAGRFCKASPQSENRVHLQPHHAQLRKKRNMSKKEPVWRSSTGASGLPRRRSGGLRWHPSQVCRTWLLPQKLSSPSQSLYMDTGMVMMPKKGVPRAGAMGGSMGSTRLTKPVAVDVYISPNISPCSYRDRRPARP
jgi:hypothetical protein